MKLRNGYVSNSSSSSFIIETANDDDENNLIEEIDEETIKELEDNDPFSIFENTDEVTEEKDKE